ncbi:MAG: NAD(P)-binding domain-containing protein, partial [Porcipelethomonas sp.]
MKRKIGFIGAGNMGSAIMRGVSLSELRWEIEIY